MNFLAHAFLAYGNEDLIIGNMVTDLIRKKEESYFSVEIQKGIDMHRYIDQFVDTHASVRVCTALIRENQGKYAPVIMDLFWDLILVEKWESLSETSFDQFIKEVYSYLNKHMPNFFPRLIKRFGFLLDKDFLRMYSTKKGMQTILMKMQERTHFKSNFSEALLDYEEHHAAISASFDHFFPQLQQATQEKYFSEI